MNKTTARETDGRFGFSNMDLICKCGHRLGDHTATKRGYGGVCIHDGSDDCGCEKFKPARR